MVTCFVSSQLSLLFVLLLVIISSCDARKKHHRKAKVHPLTPWTQWRCVSDGQYLERTRKLKAHGHRFCPGGVGICHKIQTQTKKAAGKCGKCGIDMTNAILTLSTTATNVMNISIGYGFGVDGIATLGNDVYVLCRNFSTFYPPQHHHINVYDASAGYSLKRTFSPPAYSSGNTMLGLTACEAEGYIYFTDLIKHLIYRIDANSNEISWQANFVDEFAYGYPYYDDITDDSGCNIAVASFDPIIQEFTKDGVIVVNVSLSGVRRTYSVSQVPGCYVVSYQIGDSDSPGYVSLFNAFGKIVTNTTGTTLSFATSVIANGAYVLAADWSNRRVVLLDSKLAYIKDLVTGLYPNHMWLDVFKSRLYLGATGEEFVYIYTLK